MWCGRLGVGVGGSVGGRNGWAEAVEDSIDVQRACQRRGGNATHLWGRHSRRGGASILVGPWCGPAVFRSEAVRVRVRGSQVEGDNSTSARVPREACSGLNPEGGLTPVLTTPSAIPHPRRGETPTPWAD
jgi:hypothetical protein